MKADEEALTAERLRELLDYSPETGEFRWRVDRGGTAGAGSVAGYTDSKGYCSIRIEGNDYLAHRVAWKYVHGAGPARGIDHRNGIRNDNRIVNLREATQSENMENQRKARADSKTGLLGTSRKTHSNKFRAQIKINGRSKSIGLFKTAEEAHQAYLKAKRKLHSHCTL